jgi:hypothetical protein
LVGGGGFLTRLLDGGGLWTTPPDGGGGLLTRLPDGGGGREPVLPPVQLMPTATQQSSAVAYELAAWAHRDCGVSRS